MKTKLNLLMLLLAMSWNGHLARGQGTAFTYQGRLEDGGSPANGSYDLTFALLDSESAGNQIGNTLTNTAVGASNGLFNVTLDFGNAVFDGSPRWLEISVRTNGAGAFATLSPRQALTPSPYAIFAGNAGAVAAGSVVQSLNTLKDDVTLAAGSNVTITPSGNTLTIASAGAGGSGIWSLNGANTFYNGGNVGIGTSMPASSLEVDAQDALQLRGNAPFLTFVDTNAANARGVIRTVNGSVHLYTESYMNGANPLAFLALNNSGNVGIGEGYPVGKLEVFAQDALHLRGNAPFLTFVDTNAANARGVIRSANGAVDLFTESYMNGANPNAYIHLANSGNVGIGAANPAENLTIANVAGPNSGLKVTGFANAGVGMAIENTYPGGHKYDLVSGGYFSSAGAFRIVDETANTERFVIAANGNVGINTSTPQTALDVRGTTQTKVLTITGGADLAEPFELSGAEASKGAVVVIDDQHPGRLKLSAEAYDTRVAGIISGANGINPGISLRQEGAMAAGQNVALSGRVYVQADATFGAIRPGDLLTTSDTPGHAMKVTDHTRATGAILGKAMSSLKDGKGMVLVLVTLQ